MFVPDPDRLATTETEMVAQAGSDPERDSALCDGCFYKRARRQEAHGLN
jgi:hypothetical protein